MAQIAINFQPDHLFCTQPTDRLAPHASYPRVHKNRSRKERVYYAVRCQMFSSIRCWRQRTWKSKIPLPAKYGLLRSKVSNVFLHSLLTSKNMEIENPATCKVRSEIRFLNAIKYSPNVNSQADC